MRTLFTDGWEFAKLPFGCGRDEALKTGAFSPVRIPHDWLIGQTEDLYETSTGWYRKSFDIQPAGRHCLIIFDGVYMDTSVYINGVHAGEWKYETNFRIQTTPSTRGQFKSEEEYQRYKTNYERFEKNMTDYKEMGTSVWSQNIFELKIDFGNSTIKGDYPQVLWRSNPISYDEHELTWSFDGEIWWKDNKNYANKFSGIEHYSVKDHDEQGRPSRIEGHLVGTILVGEHFFVVDALSSFTKETKKEETLST